MASRIIHELCVSVRQYPAKDGNGNQIMKNQYQKIGNMFEKDDKGRFIILDPFINLAGVPHEPGKGVMVSMFDPKPRDGQQHSGTSQPQASNGDDQQFGDTIPF
jgi:hypothetical protein